MVKIQMAKKDNEKIPQPKKIEPEGYGEIGRELIKGLKNLFTERHFENSSATYGTSIEGFLDSQSNRGFVNEEFGGEDINFDFVFQVHVDNSSKVTKVYGEGKNLSNHTYCEKDFLIFIHKSMKLLIKYFNARDNVRFLFLTNNCFDLRRMNWDDIKDDIKFREYIFNPDLDDIRTEGAKKVLSEIRELFELYNSRTDIQSELEKINQKLMVLIIPINLFKLILGAQYYE